MADEPDPPRKVYGFKDREFKRDEHPSSASRPPVSVKDLAKLAGPVTRSVPVPSNAPKPGDPNDVHAILQRNRLAENKSGGDEVEFKPVPSRRKRDYWLLLICGNLAILAPSAILGVNAMTLGAGIGGIIIYSIGLTWIMWQVMGKY